MSLQDLNVEPNILLILLGSLFILIGASGKILIEKFFVAVASRGPRLFISILGLLMLGIGILGPNKILPKQESSTGAANHTLVQSGDDTNVAASWIQQIPGAYVGTATSAGQDIPVTTTFVLDDRGRLTGTYLLEEAQGMLGGKLENAKILGLGTIQFEWIDDAGRGTLRVVFSEDLNSFTGNWGDNAQLELGYKWNGKKK